MRFLNMPVIAHLNHTEEGFELQTISREETNQEQNFAEEHSEEVLQEQASLLRRLASSFFNVRTKRIIKKFLVGFTIGSIVTTAVCCPLAILYFLQEKQTPLLFSNEQEAFSYNNATSYKDVEKFVDIEFLKLFFLYNFENLSDAWVVALKEMGFASFKGGWLPSRIHRIVSGLFGGGLGEAIIFCDQIKETQIFSLCFEALVLSNSSIDPSCLRVKSIYSGFIKSELARIKNSSVEEMVCGIDL